MKVLAGEVRANDSMVNSVTNPMVSVGDSSDIGPASTIN